MKVICLFLAFFLFGCEKSSNDVQANQQADILTGVWCLKNYSPGFGPQEVFNPNDIIWQFNSNNTLTVTINATLQSNSGVPITSNSNVTYSLVNSTSVTIQNVLYNLSIQNNKLILDTNPSADGKRIEFDKIEI
jgi:hypothetical protein